MMFIKNSANSHGWVNPRDVEDIWKDHFDYFYREYDEFICKCTVEPESRSRSLGLVFQAVEALTNMMSSPHDDSS